MMKTWRQEHASVTNQGHQRLALFLFESCGDAKTKRVRSQDDGKLAKEDELTDAAEHALGGDAEKEDVSDLVCPVSQI